MSKLWLSHALYILDCYDMSLSIHTLFSFSVYLNILSCSVVFCFVLFCSIFNNVFYEPQVLLFFFSHFSLSCILSLFFPSTSFPILFLISPLFFSLFSILHLIYQLLLLLKPPCAGRDTTLCHILASSSFSYSLEIFCPPLKLSTQYPQPLPYAIFKKQFLNSKRTWFERISMCVIILNCVTLGMYQPCSDEVCTTVRCRLLEGFDHFIFAFFAIEMLIKMVAMGVWGKDTYLAEAWNRLDCFIVVAG